ncbi:hypothetical protein Tco_0833687 [Tanacetum coccineum]
MTKTREGYGSVIARPKIEEKDHFELKGQFLKELHDNTFSGSDNEDANEHIKKVLKIVDLIESAGSIKNWETLKEKFLSKYCPPARIAKKMEEFNNFQQDLDETLYQNVNEKVYAAQVGCELCKGPHYTKYCPLKEEGKTLEESYYTQFGVPFQQGGQYRAAAPGFYQRNNGNPSYQERRQTMEELLSKFMAESAKRHEENSNMIKKIRAAMDSAIRNQGALIKALEIQIGQMNKVLQERGSRSLPSSIETNPRDHVKLISTTDEADTFLIRRIGPSRYAVSGLQNSSMFFMPSRTTIPFPSCLYDDLCDGEEGSCGLKYLDAYSIGTTLLDDALPAKEKD